ncbi:MAG: 3'-5' exonuclease, partial [Thermoguttaceae bacterium]|nr:3'-5' exonuclease [Thermoguttaceae bacterium]
IVILTSLDASSKATPFKACGVSIGETDVDDPLKNRAVHCWPWPFAKQTKIMEQMNLDHHPIVLSELEEEKRLFYVGLTRAKNQIVFALPVAGGDVKYKVPAESNESQQRENVHAESENAPPAKSKKTKTAKPKMIEKTKRQYTPKCNLLDRVSPGLFHWPNLDNWPMQDKEPVKKITVPGWNIANSDEPFELEMLLLQESDPLGFDRELPGVCVDPLPKDVPFERYPAYLSPSLAEKQTGKATLIDRWEVMAQDGRLVWDDDVYARFGNAFHEFVAMGPEGESSSAEQILAHWNIDKAFAPGFKTAVDRFYEHVKSKWPGGQIMTEMPITLLTEHGRRYQGYIDFLIETDDGFVIIDHKTHKSNSDDEFGLYASGQKAQLQIYRQAVQKATGKNVFETIIHFPLGSRMYRVETDD